MPPLHWRLSLSLALLFPYHFPYHFLMFSAQRFPTAGRNHWQLCEVKRFLMSVHGLHVPVHAQETRDLVFFSVFVHM